MKDTREKEYGEKKQTHNTPLVRQLCSCVRAPEGGPSQPGFCVPAGLWTAVVGDGSLWGRTHTEQATVPSPPLPLSVGALSPL